MLTFTRLSKYLKNRYLFKIITGIIVGHILFSLLSIPIKIFFTKIQFSQPQAILVLSSRERTAAAIERIWKNGHQDLPIWVSDRQKNILDLGNFVEEINFPRNKIFLDGRASDTVTNFTTLVDDFEKANLRHLYLVTHDVHMTRSIVIATIVLGSRGIIVTPFPLSTEGSYVAPHRRDRFDNTTRDGIRSLIWFFTGKTGASLKK